MGLEKSFEAMNLPIVPETGSEPADVLADVRNRLLLMNAIRNVIEHNRSVVNSDFLRLIPDSTWTSGQQITLSEAELGDAFSAVEWTADDLNRRATEKFAVDKPA